MVTEGFHKFLHVFIAIENEGHKANAPLGLEVPPCYRIGVRQDQPFLMLPYFPNVAFGQGIKLLG